MSKVTLICKTPGFRRAGIAHPATETYPLDRWTDDELAAFEADPNFTVVVDRGDAAPIPGVSAALGLSVGEADLLRMNDAFESFFRTLDARIEDALRQFSEALPHWGIDWAGSATDRTELRETLLAGSLAASASAAVVQPADVAPGADVSDAVQDNGAGPAINDLGAKSAGVAEAAAIGTAEGIRPPVFDDARIQSIRVALKGFGSDFEPVSRPDRKKLREALGFEPTPEEIAAARIEAIAPEAIVKT